MLCTARISQWNKIRWSEWIHCWPLTFGWLTIWNSFRLIVGKNTFSLYDHWVRCVWESWVYCKRHRRTRNRQRGGGWLLSRYGPILVDKVEDRTRQHKQGNVDGLQIRAFWYAEGMKGHNNTVFSVMVISDRGCRMEFGGWGGAGLVVWAPHRANLGLTSHPTTGGARKDRTRHRTLIASAECVEK